ncbi:EcsC family protein [Cypionkella sinensis]|uniref:EcsC family protein n=1 Tax=Cypionkella sinensis TaxID=1756043 RepID=A0ABV7J6Q2_9RHOB
MTQLPAVRAPANDTEIAELARAYKRANGPLMTLVNKIGGGLEKQAALLPDALRGQIEQVVIRALTAAHGVAGLADQGPRMGGRASTLAAMATGAAGGAGGLVTAIAELPVTVTLMLHTIRAEAIRAGFDPSEPGIRAACLEVFAAGTPLAGDDGVNAAFFSARMTLTGPAIQKLIATVAPKLAATMGQKLAAQAVPVLGAVSGAALNAAFLSYYREMARIRFALMRLAETQGGEAVVAAFARAIEPPKISKV